MIHPETYHSALLSARLNPGGIRLEFISTMGCLKTSFTLNRNSITCGTVQIVLFEEHRGKISIRRALGKRKPGRGSGKTHPAVSTPLSPVHNREKCLVYRRRSLRVGGSRASSGIIGKTGKNWYANWQIERVVFDSGVQHTVVGVLFWPSSTSFANAEPERTESYGRYSVRLLPVQWTKRRGALSRP